MTTEVTISELDPITGITGNEFLEIERTNQGNYKGSLETLKDWILIEVFGLPAGGTAGQVLVKVGTEDGVATWTTLTLTTSFLSLSDTPDSYADQGGKGIRVNSGATGLEFYTLPTIPTNVSAFTNDASYTTLTEVGAAGFLTGIPDNSVTSAKIANNAVTSEKIANNAVATAKIADGAITSAKIADSAIATADIADGAVAYSKIQNTTSGNVVIGKGTSGGGTVGEIPIGTGANNLVRLDGSARLPAVDGSQLTNLSASGGSSTIELVQIVQGSQSLAYSSNGDTNGLFNYLRVNEAGNANPVPSRVTNSIVNKEGNGDIRSTASNDTNFTDRTINSSYQANGQIREVTFDLLSACFKPNQFTVNVAQSIATITVTLSVSNDNTNFTNLGNTITVPSNGNTSTWYSSGSFSLPSENYRYIRLTYQHGGSNFVNYITTEIELYGEYTPSTVSNIILPSTWGGKLAYNNLYTVNFSLSIPDTTTGFPAGWFCYIRDDTTAGTITVSPQNGNVTITSPNGNTLAKDDLYLLIHNGSKSWFLQRITNQIKSISTGLNLSASGVLTNTAVITTSVITSNTTAVSNTRYLCNTSSASFTLTLPASPSNGDVIEVADFNNSSLLTGFGTNPLTITANTGHNIVGNTNLVLDRGGQGVELVFHSNRWSIVSGIGESSTLVLLQNQLLAEVQAVMLSGGF